MPEYEASSFRPYAPILREILAVLAGDYPGQQGMALPRKTLDDLGWPQLLERLAYYCTGEEAREAALKLPVLQHRASVKRRLVEVEEAVRLLTEDVAPPLQGLTSIGAFLDHVARDGVLDAEHLRAVARAARVAEESRRYFASRVHLAPLLGQVGDDLQVAPEVVATVEHAFDAAGRLADHASPDLGALRRRVNQCQEKIKRRIDDYLRSHDFQQHLQDEYYTVRGDRYVLPIRSGAKGHVPGIVHGTSGSGQTIFIEPTEFVELNNDLRLSQMEVADEERRILRRLSELVNKARPRLEANIDLLAYLDLTMAQGRLAIELDAYRPELATDPVLELIQGRHPMLVLKSVLSEEPFPVIPNDIRVGDTNEAGEHQRVLIVSGPNTGGKTVTLKTIGTCSLMTRAGMLIPAAPGSKVPLYSGIFSDIGDEQSIARDLSTFSGHVTNINSFLPQVDEGALVLLDELFAGTDPAQGSALAIGLLEHLEGLGATVVVTTHLDGVKTVGFDHPRFANAAVGFDVGGLQPTYALSMGLPGSSYAIRIARKLGMPDVVLRRANDIVEGAGKADIERVLRELEHQREMLGIERNRAREIQSEAIKEKADYERKLRELKARNQTWIDREAREVLDQLRAAHEFVRQKVAQLQDAANPKTITHTDLNELRRELDAVKKKVDPVLAARGEEVDEDRFRLGPKGVAVGKRVWLKSFKREGTILELDDRKGKATVQVGAVRASVDLTELFTLTSSEEKRQRLRDRTAAPRDTAASDAEDAERPARTIAPQYDDNTVDLRGMRTDEAVERIEMFLDRAYHDNEPGIYIIHGHGTGALKQGVRQMLPKLRYVHSYRPGERGEGGDGVTVVFLR